MSNETLLQVRGTLCFKNGALATNLNPFHFELEKQGEFSEEISEGILYTEVVRYSTNDPHAVNVSNSSAATFVLKIGWEVADGIKKFFGNRLKIERVTVESARQNNEYLHSFYLTFLGTKDDPRLTNKEDS